MNLDCFPYKVSYSEIEPNFLVGGLACSIFRTPLVLIKETPNSRCVCDQNAAFWLPFGRTNISIKKQKIKRRICSKWSLIRIMCAWILLWSHHSHPEVTSDQTIPILRWPLIIPSPHRSDLWSYHPRQKWPLIIPSPDWSDLWSYHPQTELTSDHTIPRLKWLLIIPFPDRVNLWSYHPQTEVTSDHTIVRSNQIPDPVILVWEHTVCVGLGLIRGHFRMAPQPGMILKKSNAIQN